MLKKIKELTVGQKFQDPKVEGEFIHIGPSPCGQRHAYWYRWSSKDPFTPSFTVDGDWAVSIKDHDKDDT